MTAVDPGAPVVSGTGRAALVARGLVLAYGGRRVLDGVDLDLVPGRITALLGPNGAGKTSLMRLLAGGLRPGAGTVRLHGEDPRTSARARARIGWVPQDIALYPRLTARENVEVFARLAGVPRRALAARVASSLARTGAAEVAGTLVGQLSGGYQRRVNVAAALSAEPAIVLLDEPSSGVDRAARAAIHGALDGLRRAGAAVLVATHDFVEAERLADDVVVLDAGRVVALDHLASLLDRQRCGPPEHEAVLDDPAEGLVAARLAAGGFAPAGPLSWRAPGPLADGREGAALLAALRADGVPIRELRVHARGLEAYYLAAVGQGPGRHDGRRDAAP